MLGLRAGRVGLGAQPAARVFCLATTTVVAAGKGTWELAQLVGLAGVNSTDCVGLITVTSPKRVSASFVPFCPLCLHRQRQSLEHLEGSQGKGAELRGNRV